MTLPVNPENQLFDHFINTLGMPPIHNVAADRIRARAVDILVSRRKSHAIKHPFTSQKLWVSQPSVSYYQDRKIESLLVAEKLTLQRKHIAEQLIYLVVNEQFSAPAVTIYPARNNNESAFISSGDTLIDESLFPELEALVNNIDLESTPVLIHD